MLYFFIILVILLILKLRFSTYLPKIVGLLLVSTVVFFVVSIIFYPKEAFQSAKLGIDMWFNIVFPSLLPFFIGAELLIRLGVVNFLGSLLEPVIHPLFNVPGEGSFVFAMSLTSGYPVGVKLTSKLRKDNVFSKEEGQRVMSFSSTSGPLFMLGAVSIGMFHSLELGIIIMSAHYLGAIATGIAFRFYKLNRKAAPAQSCRKHSISSAIRNLLDYNANHRKPFGMILGESVRESIDTMLVVGGFVILFSVIIRILTILNVITFLSTLLLPIWRLFGIHQDIQHGIISGIFEITVGCKLLSEVQNISFLQQAVIATMIISWSGLSIIAQAVSMISSTDLSTSVYIFSKLIHSLFSGIFAFLLVPIYQFALNHLNVAVFSPSEVTTITETWLEKIIFSSQLFIIITLTLVFISVCFAGFLSKISRIPYTKK